MKLGTILVRNSTSNQSDDAAPRILLDPTVARGKTGTPMVFKDRKEARKYAQDNGLDGFEPLVLGKHRESGTFFRKLVGKAG